MKALVEELQEVEELGAGIGSGEEFRQGGTCAELWNLAQNLAKIGERITLQPLDLPSTTKELATGPY